MIGTLGGLIRYLLRYLLGLRPAAFGNAARLAACGVRLWLPATATGYGYRQRLSAGSRRLQPAAES